MEEDRIIPTWQDYFFGLAKEASKRSGCLRAQVGTVIVNQDKFVVSTGYNSTPSKIESCYEKGECYRIRNNIPSGTRYETCRSLHAEMNAIIQAGRNEGKWSTMYIYGHSEVCMMCKRFIIQSGIARVFLKKDDNSEVQIIKPREEWNNL